MLKQISMALAILCASITVTIFPAMSEINQPDATAKEKQIEDSKQSSEIKETNKKKGSHRHGDMRRKGRFGRGKKTRHKSRFEGQRHGRSRITPMLTGQKLACHEPCPFVWHVTKIRLVLYVLGNI